jgi:hypothetical protein
LHGHTRVRCELVDHGDFGFEARILYNEEHHMSHTFAPCHCIPLLNAADGGDSLGRDRAESRWWA